MLLVRGVSSCKSSPLCMNSSESTVELRIQSSLDYTDLVENLTNNLTTMAGCDSDHAYFIEMAVREVLINAIRHGNQFDLQKHVRVQFRFDAARFEVQINDEGRGFDYEHLPDPCDPANLLKSSGRGIFLVRSFMDDFSLIYVPDQGTEVKFAKKLARP
jgi:serine/threonine-protein kinase RsbW